MKNTELMRWCLILGFWLTGLVVLAQEGLPPIVFNGQPVTKRGLDVRPYTQFFPDSSSDPNRSLAWVRRQQFYPFKPGLRYRWDVSINWSRQQVWFRFSITNTHPTDTIRLYYLRIPPLLLQPYVENAIWHGLMHKTEGGAVLIEVSLPKENLLNIDITDDGVGRQRASTLRSKSAGRHKSFGMQVTADRIRMINQLYNSQTQAEVMDLVDSFGEACSTKVILNIPV